MREAERSEVGTLSDYVAAIDEMVLGENIPLGQEAKLRAVAKALRTHSRHRPRRIIEDVEGNGGFDYPLSSTDEEHPAVAEEWQAGFSRVLQVEYPVDDASDTPNILEECDWGIYEKPAGEVLRFVSATPRALEYFRLTYSAPHAFDEAGCTAAISDEEAVETLAAAYFCRMVASAYAQSQDSTIQADSVDHSSKRREYEAQAKAYFAEYYQHLGIKEGEVRPASAIQDQDVDHPAGWDRLTHPRRQR
jgi:hypothetical protein